MYYKSKESEDPPKSETYRRYDLNVGGHTDSVYCLQFYGSRIVSSSGDKRILVWDFNPHTLYRVKPTEITAKKKKSFRNPFKKND